MPYQKNKLREQKLLDIFSRYSDHVPFHQWADEGDRWRELVICFLFANGGESRGRAREAADLLHKLNLLNIADLAAIPMKKSQPDWRNTQAVLIREVLRRQGFEDADIVSALILTLKISRLIQKNYGGKIQLYLRQYGLFMLEKLNMDFPGASSSRKETRGKHTDRLKYAFAMWLQNTLTMPIFLDTPNIRRFCRSIGCTLDELHRVADDLNINASVVDDLIDLWALEEEV